MATRVDIAGTNISASQLREFFRLAAIPETHINRATFQDYLESRNPFRFERNQHGHIIITITGLDLTGEQEIERLEAAGYRLSGHAKFCFKSTAVDGYDASPRLVAGRQYKIAIVPLREISRDPDRTTVALRELGLKYGYGKPCAGHVPRICESVSDQQMEEMGLRYIASLHDPITDSNDVASVLCARRTMGGGRIIACLGHPLSLWDDDGAVAFPVV